MQQHWKDLAAGLVLATLGAPAAYGEVSVNVALTSDYVWRGVSQTDENPALQAGAEYAHEIGVYFGVWGNVDFAEEDVDDPARIELDYSIGWRGETEGGLGWDLGLLRYTYPNTTADFDYNELTLSLSYEMFTFEVDYSNDTFATGTDTFYYNIGASHEFPDLFEISANVGYSDLNQEVTGEGAPDSYVDWHIGVSREFLGVDFDLSYYDTNGNGEDIYGDLATDRLVLTVSKSF
jgi:uncharacterized protein (TIGR02001 family)